jgi:hypothetical protein
MWNRRRQLFLLSPPGKVSSSANRIEVEEALLFEFTERIGGFLRLGEMGRDFQRLIVSIERFGGFPRLGETATQLKKSICRGLSYEGTRKVINGFLRSTCFVC